MEPGERGVNWKTRTVPPKIAPASTASWPYFASSYDPKRTDTTCVIGIVIRCTTRLKRYIWM